MELVQEQDIVSGVTYQSLKTEDLQHERPCSGDRGVSRDILHSSGPSTHGQSDSTDDVSSDVIRYVTAIKCEPGWTEASYEDDSVDNVGRPPYSKTHVVTGTSSNDTDDTSRLSGVTKCVTVIKCEPDQHVDGAMCSTMHDTIRTSFENHHVGTVDCPPSSVTQDTVDGPVCGETQDTVDGPVCGMTQDTVDGPVCGLTQDIVDGSVCSVTQVIVKSEDGDPEEYNCTRRWVVQEDGELKEVFEVKRAGTSSHPHTADDRDIQHLQCSLEQVDDAYWQEDLKDPEFFPSSADRAPGKVPGGRRKKKATAGQSHTCCSCGKSFASSFNLVIHMRTHDGVKPYTCRTCGKAFSQFINLKGHENTHTGEKPYACRTCTRSFAHYSTLRAHERSHTGLKPYACEKCGKSFGTKNTLKTHERTNTCVKPFSCSTCERSFLDPALLERHELLHAGAKLFSCDTCGRSFAQSSTLHAHERTHSGEKPYVCAVCNRSFNRSTNLRIHERIHTGVKPFACDVCGKSFTHKCGLKAHETSHTGVKPYPCDSCGKAFVSKSSLTIHERIHKGVRPYVCSTCGKAFTQCNHLKKHERQHAGGQTASDRHSALCSKEKADSGLKSDDICSLEEV